MQDQAYKLRDLVSRTSPSSHEAGRRAIRVVLTGCKGGVGTTTLAINLAVALHSHCERILLVDANEQRGDVAAMCRLRGRQDLDDALMGRSSLQQVMQTGPAGIQVAPRFGLRDGHAVSRLNQLDRHLESVAHRFDFMLIDAGCSPAVAEMLWPVATQAIIVTTTDAVAVLDAYALMKSQSRKNALTQVASVVNRSACDAVAVDVHRRLSESCRRFLQLDLEPLGTVPTDVHLTDAAASGRPVVSWQPGVASSVAMAQIAQRLTSLFLPVENMNLNQVS